MPQKSTASASITDALIRCTRQDQAASPTFELVRADLGLWVLELHCPHSESWTSQINIICDQIEAHKTLLTSLTSDSTDLTLHLAVASEETPLLRIPVRMSRLVSECGLEIEIYTELQQV